MPRPLDPEADFLTCGSGNASLLCPMSDAVRRERSELAVALSHREMSVSRHVALGCANKFIAAELGLSLGSVATYLRRARHKLQAASRVDLIRVALSMLPPPLNLSAAHRKPFDPYCLTPAERTAAVGLLLGLTYRQIAAERKRSPRTIAVQAQSLFLKLGVSSRYELAALLLRNDFPLKRRFATTTSVQVGVKRSREWESPRPPSRQETFAARSGESHRR